MAENWLARHNAFNARAHALLRQGGLDFAMPLPSNTVLSCLFVRLPGNYRDSSFAESLVRQLQTFGPGIEAKHYYMPLTERENAPAAWKLYDHTLCLPYHMGVSEDSLTAMIGAVRTLMGSMQQRDDSQ